MKKNTEAPEPPGERLRWARQQLGLSGEAFGAAIGKSKASVSQLENGNATLVLSDCLAWEHVYGLRAGWVLTGDSTAWTREEPGGAGARESLDDVPYSSSRAQLTGLDDLEHVFLDRPLIVGGARCGAGGEIEDPGPAAARYALRKDFAAQVVKQCGGGSEYNLFFLRCQGESMSPTILDEEIVLLNTNLNGRLEPRNHAIYLVRRSLEDMDARVKRVRLDKDKRQLVLSSDNRQFSPVFVDLDGRPLHQVILGRVVWVGRYLLETDPPASDW